MKTLSRALGSTIAAAVVSLHWPGVASAQAQLEAPLGPVLAIGHRGASFIAPEHTLFAYDKALAFDVDMLECDLQMSKDGVLVCIHDTTVTRTSGGSGRVDAYTLAELRQRDWGSWFNTANPSRARPEYVGARLVTFEEQLACYLRHNPRMRFHVETKAPAEYGGKMEPALVALLTRLGLVATGDIQTSTIIIQSFDLSSLAEVKRLAPTLPTAFLFSAPTDPLIAAGILPSYVDAAAPTSTFLRANPAYVAAVHRTGKPVHTWTVDNPADMDYLLDIGIDGIFSNKPDVLRERIDAHGLGADSRVRGNPQTFPALCAFPVEPVNEPPQAADAAVSVAEDSAITISLAAADTDSPALEFSIVSPPMHGTLGSVSSASCSQAGTGSQCVATVLYLPAPNYAGPDSFTYKAHDGRADSGPATVTVSVIPGWPTDKVTGSGQVRVDGGRASFRFSVRQEPDGSASGVLEYQNHARLFDVRSTSINGLAISGNTAQFGGACETNGAPCTFTVLVEDDPQVGSRFTIQLGDGPAEGGETVAGNIQIKQK